MKYNLLWASVTTAVLFTTACNKQMDPSTQTTNGQVEEPILAAEYVYDLEKQARTKLNQLQNLMASAKEKDIDVSREETIVWLSEQFLKFANWDEANPKDVEQIFGYEKYFAKDKKRLAAEIPDFERTKVIEILDKGIDVLGQEMRGEIKRRPVRKVDWQNTVAGDNMFMSNGKPAFPYDYFSKTVGQPLTNTDIYNDHLGAIYHGGENLYPVDHDRAINSFLVKEDGSFDEELLAELTNIPDTNIGFLVAWLMGIPEWVENLEPEIRKGRSLFTGFDVDNPRARKLWRKILRKSAEVTKGKRVTELGIILANEPHWYSEKGSWAYKLQEMNGISSYTLNKFRDWLSSKYNGDITQLNTNWGKSFASFTDVDIEIPISKALKGQPIWYDWMRYNMDRGIDWFEFMQSELHAVNPELDTHVKIVAPSFLGDARTGGIDVEALSALTTMVGHDAKSYGGKSINPHKKTGDWLTKYPYDWQSVSMFHDFMESVAPDKININSESHFLSSVHWKDLDPRTSYIRSVYWLATLSGMDANMAWFWARDPDGSPEDRLEGELNFFDPALAASFAGSNNMQPHITNEVTQVMYDLNSFSEEVVALREQRRPIRLFYSETTAINTDLYMTKNKKLYEALFFNGTPLGYVTNNIINTQDNSLWDTVVVYNNPYVTDDEFATLQTYLNKGGSVILDNSEALSLNEYGEKRLEKLTAGKGRLTVLGTSDIAKITHAAIAEVKESSRPAVIISEENGNDYKTTMWRTVSKKLGSYLVNVYNLGYTPAKLNISLANGKSFTVKDLTTSNALGANIELASEGVLLLEVKVK
ncbi:glycoside hydrolase family 42 [Paraglaciecola aquimarina]|uniref:Glycoside hydrolase family 42 n=1 Tax=Paraglaciecola aquimarina TaxID=1235557 RepID=A0ABU3SXN8_9ALTE|nr:beta-galactosidase [Paraglaciecola aquimarina]MDU0354769.1 glycoside hydrolase family 42 [Paraglaciecola aquimarina]